MKKILLTGILLPLLATLGYSQCCNVISSNGINAITQNGICVTHASGTSGDCGEKIIDTDQDGIPDDKDACPTVYGTLKGCPDTDGDGIVDKDDKCPTEAGKAELEGCPEIDTDGDGIVDGADRCPTIPGTVNGCPDTDKDGIIDSQDACPTLVGTAQYNGCPDTDGDGVVDPKDACPTVAGLVTTAGCPDVDSDGIADKDDLCPTEAGIAENKGCPAVSEDEISIFDAALTGVKFQSGRDVITRASYPILDNVVKVLEAKPAYKLSIEGHTDSQGRDDLNLDLSKRRAAAVKKFLEDKGIDESRLTSEGYGETIPVADNNTAAGRAENRRVELKVIF